MLEIKRLQSAEQEPRIPPGQKERMAFAAYEAGEMIGYCLFDLSEDRVILYQLHTDPKDFSVADGLARAAAAFAEQNGKTIAEIRPGDEELGIFAAVAGAAGEILKISDLFSGCGGITEGFCGVSACSGCAGCSARCE